MVRAFLALHGFDEALDAVEGVQMAWSEADGWIIAATADYAAHIEFGTSKMQAYPFLFPAVRHVLRTKFAGFVAEAKTRPDALDWLLNRTALAIERQAKKNAAADSAADRSPGTHPAHPEVVTGNLRNSINIVPAGGVA